MLNPETFQLSLEQQFNQKTTQDAIQQLTLPEAREMLVKLTTLLAIKDNCIKELVKLNLVGAGGFPGLQKVGIKNAP